MAYDYCSANQVSSFIGITPRDTTTSPTLSEVEEMINRNEDYIDQVTGHAWRTKTVTDEYYDINNLYSTSVGIKTYLKHRKIKTMDASEGDKIEVWEGSSYVDYVASKTEGRNNDFWLDYDRGILNLRNWRYWPREFNIRMTYRYGEDTVLQNRDIEKACILLSAADLIQSDDRSVVLPEGTSNISLARKAEDWRNEAEKILSKHKELKTGVI